MQIDFYEVMPGNLVPSLVRLLAKIYTSQHKCIFLGPSEELVKALDRALWTFSTREFIPHGDKSLGFSEMQPIYLTSQYENPNNASVLVISGSFEFEQYQNIMDRILFVFENNTDTAENLFHNLQKNKKNVNYWKQSSKGWGKLL